MQYPFCKTAIPMRLFPKWQRYVNRETKWHYDENHDTVILTVYGRNATTLLQQFLIANYPQGSIGCYSDSESSCVIDATGDLIAFSALQYLVNF